jgi:hypothetical protein
MSQEFFEGLRQGLELGSRHKYLQINLLTLMKDFEKLNQKSKQNQLYELWSQVLDCYTGIEELHLDSEEDGNRAERLQVLCASFNQMRQRYKVLLDQYHTSKKNKIGAKKRKIKVVEEEDVTVVD